MYNSYLLYLCTILAVQYGAAIDCFVFSCVHSPINMYVPTDLHTYVRLPTTRGYPARGVTKQHTPPCTQEVCKATVSS